MRTNICSHATALIAPKAICFRKSRGFFVINQLANTFLTSILQIETCTLGTSVSVLCSLLVEKNGQDNGQDIEKNHVLYDKADGDNLLILFCVHNYDIPCVWLYLHHDSKWPNIRSHSNKKTSSLASRSRVCTVGLVLYLNGKTDPKSRSRLCSRWTRLRSRSV